MSDARCALLILGLGNLLCGDDGAGVVAVEQLERDFVAPEGVLLLDGGTLGLSLLPHLENAERVILVDALAAPEPVGTVLSIRGDAVANASMKRLSPHQIGVADLLTGALLRGHLPPEIRLIGVVPENTELGLGLSPEVLRAIPALVKRVVEEAAALGHPFEPRGEHAHTRPDQSSAPRVARLVGALGGR